MKKIYLAYLLLIILSACGSKNTNSVYLNGEIKGLGNDTLYIYGTDKFYNRMDTLLVKDDKFLQPSPPTHLPLHGCNSVTVQNIRFTWTKETT